MRFNWYFRLRNGDFFKREKSRDFITHIVFSCFYNTLYHRNPICIPFFVDFNVFHSPRFYIFEEIRQSTKGLGTHIPISISMRVCVSREEEMAMGWARRRFFYSHRHIKKRAGDESVDFHFLFFNFLCIMCAHKWVWGRSLMVNSCARSYYENWLAKQKADASRGAASRSAKLFRCPQKTSHGLSCVYKKMMVNKYKKSSAAEKRNWPCDIKKVPLIVRVCVLITSLRCVCLCRSRVGDFIYVCHPLKELSRILRAASTQKWPFCGMIFNERKGSHRDEKHWLPLCLFSLAGAATPNGNKPSQRLEWTNAVVWLRSALIYNAQRAVQAWDLEEIIF